MSKKISRILGQMLMNWFAKSLQSLQNLNTSLTENDLNALTLHYCTNLLVAGVIKQLDGASDSFKVRFLIFMDLRIFVLMFSFEKQYALSFLKIYNFLKNVLNHISLSLNFFKFLFQLFEHQSAKFNVSMDTQGSNES